jgi:hypothetical protein
MNIIIPLSILKSIVTSTSLILSISFYLLNNAHFCVSQFIFFKILCFFYLLFSVWFIIALYSVILKQTLYIILVWLFKIFFIQWRGPYRTKNSYVHTISWHLSAIYRFWTYQAFVPVLYMFDYRKHRIWIDKI